MGNEAKTPSEFPATVVRVIDENRIVLNRGATHGVRKGQRFLVYQLESEAIKDPVSGEELGYLEIVRGTGSATHVQDSLTTVTSDSKGPIERRVITRRNLPFVFGTEEETVTSGGGTEPFEDAKVGDKAKPI